MTQQDTEQTRVFPASTADPERTIVAPQQAYDATQMGATVSCPVCSTANAALETYCGECGFLLTSTPGSAEEPHDADTPTIALVEDTTGRKFLLHEGVNVVGRENCDVLLMDATVSRRHAEVTVSGSVVTVADLASTNGTQLDGTPLVAHQGATAREGSVLRFGNAALRLTGGQALQDASAWNAVAETEEEAPASSVETAVPVARLVALEGTSPDILIPLGVTTVGRRPGNTYVVTDDPYVSGRHAEVTATDDGITITDLGSTNGTTVNGERIAPNESLLLLESDEVTIGRGRYRLTMEAMPETGIEPSEDDDTLYDEDAE